MRRMISTARTWDDGEKRCTWGVFGNLRHYLLFLVEVIYLAVQGIVFWLRIYIVDDRLNATININGKMIAHGFPFRRIEIRRLEWLDLHNRINIMIAEQHRPVYFARRHAEKSMDTIESRDETLSSARRLGSGSTGHCCFCKRG